MKKINFRLCIACVLILSIACTVGASGVSALTTEGSDLIDKLTSVAGDLGGAVKVHEFCLGVALPPVLQVLYRHGLAAEKDVFEAFWLILVQAHLQCVAT